MNEELKELEQIVKLVKEQYRLSGKVLYEPLDPEWEQLIQGKG